MRLLLLLMVVIWGANYSLIKVVLQELPPPVFNAVRLSIAAAVFVAVLALTAKTRPTRREWIQLAGLGFYGQFLYQLFFLNGMSRTSVANASLIIGLVPIVVALTNASLGLEKLTRTYWLGTAVSLVGMYFVVGLDAGVARASLVGDLLTFCAVLAWSAYTVAAKPLLARHSSMVVSGWSITLGTLFYLPYAVPEMRNVDWPQVSAGAWIGTTVSALLSINLSYILWNRAVQTLGSSQTAIYSNLIPVAAVGTAAVWLGEPVDRWKTIGAALIIVGLVVATRFGTAGRDAIPCEE
jgi:drug/metabolite transporter (DMT)-like permease